MAGGDGWPASELTPTVAAATGRMREVSDEWKMGLLSECGMPCSHVVGMGNKGFSRRRGPSCMGLIE